MGEKWRRDSLTYPSSGGGGGGVYGASGGDRVNVFACGN